MTFRSWVSLNRVILERKHARIARAWFAARAADWRGCGWLTEHEFCRALETHLNLGDKATKVLLKDGIRSGWFERRKDHILITDQFAIANMLRTELGYSCELPVSCLKRLKLFRATLFSTFFARKGRAIKLAALCKLFDVSKQTIRTWVRLADMKRETHFGYTANPEDAPILDRPPTKPGKPAGVFTYDIDGDGQLETVFQLANFYSSPRLEAHRKRQGGKGSDYKQRAYFQRMYFDSARAVNKAMSKAQRGEVFYLQRESHQFLGRVSECLAV